MKPILAAFTPHDLIAWADGLGAQTFIGSSGRVFPKTMKASPLLRAWLARLAAQGVSIRTRMLWRGWDEAGRLVFQDGDGADGRIAAAATLLALGGASWPKLGADGSWRATLQTKGVDVTPLQPANVGFDVAWSDAFRARFAGAPLKGVMLRFGEHAARGEMMISAYGLEGGAVYALSAPLRDALARAAPVRLSIDLRPQLSHEEITAKLERAKQGDSLSSSLRKTLNLAPAAINLLREVHGGPPPSNPAALAALIKAAPIALTAPRGLDRAISTAGGIAWDALDENLMLRALPGIYAAGEMLDWEAPTGGFLLQACFATGARAAHSILKRQKLDAAPPP